MHRHNPAVQVVRLLCALGLALACSETNARPKNLGALAPASESAPTIDSGRATAAEESANDPITASNLYEREASWPNIVALVRSWPSPNDEHVVLRKAHRGVLVRVEPSGHARIDFGRHGKHTVEIEATDIVERANAVRRGERHKHAPNFVLYVGARLLDSRTAEIRPLETSALYGAKAFLCVFADPNAESFGALARRLAGLSVEEGLRPVLFPQNVRNDDILQLRERLRTTAWTVPFAYPDVSATYTKALLGKSPSAPYLLLVTPDGRVLHRSSQDRLDADLAEIMRLVEGGRRSA